MELEQQEAVELVSLMVLNTTELVDMMDINVLKDLYKDIHLGCEEVRTETRFSAKRHKAFNEQVQDHQKSNYRMVIVECVVFVLMVIGHGFYIQRVLTPKNIV